MSPIVKVQNFSINEKGGKKWLRFFREIKGVLGRILENMSSVTYNLTSSFLLVSDIYFFPPKPEGAIGISKRCEY